jgi:hypothetical protein
MRLHGTSVAVGMVRSQISLVVAQDQRECTIGRLGVILSGTATNGTFGPEAFKADGGITFVHDQSARSDSMPRSAFAAGCVDFVRWRTSPKNWRALPIPLRRGRKQKTALKSAPSDVSK